ncbi:MAG: hypothetical protein H6738_00355 [Alphaproteobacteria bacterium]|nr:hypothetical protein [Alphaproteobacteria bacterium]MCB9695218.1 hypothetical protein [Alphaproteobacteria bacterium]
MLDEETINHRVGSTRTTWTYDDQDRVLSQALQYTGPDNDQTPLVDEYEYEDGVSCGRPFVMGDWRDPAVP